MLHEVTVTEISWRPGGLLKVPQHLHWRMRVFGFLYSVEVQQIQDLYLILFWDLKPMDLLLAKAFDCQLEDDVKQG